MCPLFFYNEIGVQPVKKLLLSCQFNGELHGKLDNIVYTFRRNRISSITLFKLAVNQIVQYFCYFCICKCFIISWMLMNFLVISYNWMIFVSNIRWTTSKSCDNYSLKPGCCTYKLKRTKQTMCSHRRKHTIENYVNISCLYRNISGSFSSQEQEEE